MFIIGTYTRWKRNADNSRSRWPNQSD